MRSALHGFVTLEASRGSGCRATSTAPTRSWSTPRWLSRLGVVVGVMLGLTEEFAGPLDFLAPVWLAVVSLTLLFARRRRSPNEAGPA